MNIFFGCYQNIFWAKTSQPPRKIDPYAYALSAPLLLLLSYNYGKCGPICIVILSLNSWTNCREEIGCWSVSKSV